MALKLELKDLIYGMGLILTFLTSTISSCNRYKELDLKAKEMELKDKKTNNTIDSIHEYLLERDK